MRTLAQTNLSRVATAVIASFLVTGSVLAQAPPTPTIPPDMLTVLKQRVGHWTYEGSGQLYGTQRTVKGSTDCRAFAGGAGLVCVWSETASGLKGTRRRTQVLGYDADAKMLRASSVDNRGIAESDLADLKPSGGTIHFQGTENGQPMTGSDEISIAPDANSATEHVTVDVGGKRIVDLTLNHKRVQPK